MPRDPCHLDRVEVPLTAQRVRVDRLVGERQQVVDRRRGAEPTGGCRSAPPVALTGNGRCRASGTAARGSGSPLLVPTRRPRSMSPTFGGPRPTEREPVAADAQIVRRVLALQRELGGRRRIRLDSSRGRIRTRAPSSTDAPAAGRRRALPGRGSPSRSSRTWSDACGSTPARRPTDLRGPYRSRGWAQGAAAAGGRGRRGMPSTTAAPPRAAGLARGVGTLEATGLEAGNAILRGQLISCVPGDGGIVELDPQAGPAARGGRRPRLGGSARPGTRRVARGPARLVEDLDERSATDTGRDVEVRQQPDAVRPAVRREPPVARERQLAQRPAARHPRRRGPRPAGRRRTRRRRARPTLGERPRHLATGDPVPVPAARNAASPRRSVPARGSSSHSTSHSASRDAIAARRPDRATAACRRPSASPG